MRRRYLEGFKGNYQLLYGGTWSQLERKKKLPPRYLSILGLRTDTSSWHINNQHNQPTNNHLNSNSCFPPIHCTWVSTNVNGAPAFLGRRNAPSTVLPSSKAKGMATWKQPSGEGRGGNPEGGRGGKNEDNKQERQETTATTTTTTTTTEEEEEKEKENQKGEEDEEWAEEGKEYMWCKKYLRRATLCLDLLNRTVSVKRNGQRKSQRSISSFRVEETFYLIIMFSASRSSFYNIPPLGPQTELHWWGKTTLAKRREKPARFSQRVAASLEPVGCGEHNPSHLAVRMASRSHFLTSIFWGLYWPTFARGLCHAFCHRPCRVTWQWKSPVIREYPLNRDPKSIGFLFPTTESFQVKFLLPLVHVEFGGILKWNRSWIWIKGQIRQLRARRMQNTIPALEIYVLLGEFTLITTTSKFSLFLNCLLGLDQMAWLFIT